jgi:primosomal protein N'
MRRRARSGAADAAREFVDAVQAAEFAPFLLDGVTGSGKTEVYFEAVAEALRMGGRRSSCCPRSRSPSRS